jgi:hypothetical protein
VCACVSRRSAIHLGDCKLAPGVDQIHFRECVYVAKSLRGNPQPLVAYDLRLEKYFANHVFKLAKWQGTRPHAQSAA